MSGVSGMRVVVAGGGAVGACVALALDRRGALVTLADPAPMGANASGVAAGMLAPVFETVLDGGGEHYDLLRAARERWTAFAATIGVELDTLGALGVGGTADLDVWEGAAARLGAAPRRLTRADAEALLAGLTAPDGGLLVADDSRIDPMAALAALRRASVDVSRVSAGVADFASGRARLTSGEWIDADAMVIATGPSRSLAALAPRLADLTPVKGHILRAPGFTTAGPMIRLARGYICPGTEGAVIGASMEVGVEDTATDRSIVEDLRRQVAGAVPCLSGAAVSAQAGVRAATLDGLPWVGPAVAPGVWLAVGMRRNGWLLAPLVADLIVAEVGGEAEPAFARRLDPARPSRA